jgi:cell division protein FtsI (penicillin-binding protein 3)/stage V sporulation protein D (sporulation-specific penicillin-binding protein)
MGYTVNHRERALYVVLFLAMGFTVISMRLVQIMMIDHEKYEDLAIQNHWRRIELPARRGEIVDCNGNVLAQTQILHDVRLDGRKLKNPTESLSKIARTLGLDPRALVNGFDPQNRYWLLKEDVADATITALKDLKIPNLIYVEKFCRSYPNSSHASHAIGFLGNQNRGVSGVEKEMDRYLRGIPGERWIEKDGRRQEIAAYRRKDLPPTDGLTVVLTLDLAIQHVVEEQLDKIMAKYQASAAYAIVVRPKTGEILAMANRPTFDPNQRRQIAVAAMRNRCVTDCVEPGSTFKIVTIAGALNEKLISLDTPVYCENGSFFYGGHYLRDHEPYGMLSVEQVLANSSNIGTAKIALEQLHDDRLYEYVTAFGFGRPTGVFSGQSEAAGILRPLSKWSKLSVTRVCIGQEVAATPMQMIMAMSAIANGGRLMAPRLIKQVNDSSGKPLEIYPPKVLRQVIAPETAGQVAQALMSVVSDNGTAPKAKVPGFSVAGKTGTAQKFINGNYSREKYLSSFIGFLPVEDPQFVVLVMVDEPKGREYYGGQVAAPAFSEMSQQIAQYLNLVPNSSIAMGGKQGL